jgi:hypothetical protein
MARQPKLRSSVGCLVPLAGSLKANNIRILQGGLSRLSSIEAQREFSGSVPPIIERDVGQFQIGIEDDAAGPFPSRAFSAAVADHRKTGDPPDKRRRPRRANPRAHFNFVRAAAKHSYANPESLSSREVRS